MAELLPVMGAILTPKGEGKLQTVEKRLETWDASDLDADDLKVYGVLSVVDELGFMPANMTAQDIFAFMSKGYIELVGQLDTEEFEGRLGRLK